MKRTFDLINPNEPKDHWIFVRITYCINCGTQIRYQGREPLKEFCSDECLAEHEQVMGWVLEDDI